MAPVYLLRDGEKQEIDPSDFEEYKGEFFPDNTVKDLSYSERVEYVSETLDKLGSKAREHLDELVEETGQSPEMLKEEISKIEMASDERYLNMIKDIGGSYLGEAMEDWVYDAETNQHKKAVPLGKGVCINPGHNPAQMSLSVPWPILAGNSVLHKMPSKDQLTLKLLHEVFEEEDNPVSESSAIAQWKGGGKGLEDFEREVLSQDYVMAWGDDSTIEAINRKRPPYTRPISFHHEYGAYMVDEHIQKNYDDDLLRKIAEDFSWGDQNVCFSPQIMLLEDHGKATEKFMDDFVGAMEETANKWPRGDLPESAAKSIRDDIWTAEDFEWLKADHEDFTVTLRDQPPEKLGGFNGYRFVEAYKVDDLEEGIGVIEKSRNLQDIVLATSDSRRDSLRDKVATKTNANRITVPGEALPSRPIPWDGKIPLEQLVEWTTDEREMPENVGDVLYNKAKNILS